MSFEPDTASHELTTEELLLRILNELSIIRMHHEIITGQEIKVEDINED